MAGNVLQIRQPILTWTTSSQTIRRLLFEHKLLWLRQDDLFMIAKEERQVQSSASTISLNLIESHSDQLNQISSIDDHQIQTLVCVTQLGSVLYGNGICHDLYHRHHRNSFRWIRTLLIRTARMIDHLNHSNCSQNPPVTPSSIWWQPIRAECEPLGAATCVIKFFYLEPRSDQG